MQMDAGLDTGAIISARGVSIEPRDTAATLTDRLAAIGGEAIVETLNRLERDGHVEAFAQQKDGASYARKISRDDAAIDWRVPALDIDRQVRALNPFPGALTSLAAERIKIWAAEPASGDFGVAGTVVRADRDDLVIACGEGALAVLELQRAGGRRLAAADFLSGNPIEIGSRAGPAAVN